MELIYAYTAPFCEFLRRLPEQDRQAVRESLNRLGKDILRDYDAPRQELYQPVVLMLRHDYTPTLSVLPVTGNVVVLLCYERDELHEQMQISLLDAAPPEEAETKYLMLAKVLYGKLLRGTA